MNTRSLENLTFDLEVETKILELIKTLGVDKLKYDRTAAQSDRIFLLKMNIDKLNKDQLSFKLE